MSDSPHAADWPGARLHVVTGKGGTGKTTVASALALTLASLGHKVLLAEVEGRQGISQAFDVAPLADDERLVLRVSGGGEIWGLAVDAKAALLEYLSMFYKLGRAGGVLERMGAIDFATTIAPGVRDVLLIGKVYEAVRRRAERGRPTRAGTSPWVYDAVVLDAPHRPGRPLPQRQRRGGGAGEDGADPRPGRLDHPHAALGHVRRPHHDLARGHAGAGDDRRRRRPGAHPGPARRDHRQPGT
ncbi:ArsA-related P-loop ATPase [Mobilicoccus caccae]|uniref:ArsA/GET3 Anion-transporting ATPase-like domain-containing protein n=1 Tax=Mobilicoccus caccae TaxID=1859295 RepID=A0ABQ6IM50_9MICO|nr:hypothetical protein GCM10025883_03230 [Mobilicoccus caccae]